MILFKISGLGDNPSICSNNRFDCVLVSHLTKGNERKQIKNLGRQYIPKSLIRRMAAEFKPLITAAMPSKLFV